MSYLSLSTSCIFWKRGIKNCFLTVFYQFLEPETNLHIYTYTAFKVSGFSILNELVEFSMVESWSNLKFLTWHQLDDLPWNDPHIKYFTILKKNITHMWRRWGTPQNFFSALIDELEKQIIIKKLLKWAIKKQNNLNIYHVASFLKK